ncbi:MAG: type II toxin-antitoxin system RelE/ParE family toxin [Calothrix sp. MO_192.B10]|nr:type II toxin-antitoxin system RelE/ParE family toxin [Calothrix sp. MO_192.B10]
MTSEIEYTDEFESQWLELDESTQDKVAFVVGLLQEKGVNLDSKYSSGINGSRYGHMRELKVKFRGQPFRILYAFDPRRVAILLLVGNKGGNNRWYEENIPKADRLYEEHLNELRNEGLMS